MSEGLPFSSGLRTKKEWKSITLLHSLFTLLLQFGNFVEAEGFERWFILLGRLRARPSLRRHLERHVGISHLLHGSLTLLAVVRERSPCADLESSLVHHCLLVLGRHYHCRLDRSQSQGRLRIILEGADGLRV